ncbi:hypothetical protein MFIFM68171_08438 [Madurella fahalii]|uniref:Isotrichodermin C-15 hydroxylase n=1 Tax=Madurella fahalii TaxID=1157608 RepID=A0ABQ0GKF0_9PEZI
MEYLGPVPSQTYLYAAGGLAALYTVSTILYNLFFHPLASYPGPLLNRATSLRYAWALATGYSAQYAHRLHEKYGSVVRLSPNHLSYVDPRAWRDVYGHRAANGQEEHPKSPTFYRALMPGAATNIIDAGREDHSRLRKALAHGFSEKALRSQEGRILHFVDLLMSKLAAKAAAKEAVDLVEWFTWTTFDLASDLVFALSFGCLEKEEDHLFVKLNNEGLAPSGILVALYYVGFRRVADLLTSGLQALAREFFAELGRLLQNRLDEKTEKDDLFEGLIQHKDEWNLGNRELESNAMVLVVAGSETTSTLLAGVTYLLLSNPDAMEKVKREVRGAYKSADEISLSTIDRLPYLVACMSEALRCYPPVLNSLAREAPEGGSMIAGKFVAPGTIVEVQNWSVNHSSLHWEDPWAFKPERFLHGSAAEGGKKSMRDNMDAFNPFSTGPRNCLGRNLAYAEMRLIFARLIYQFDLSLVNEDKDWIKKQRAFSFWEKKPLNVRLTPVVGAKLRA